MMSKIYLVSPEHNFFADGEVKAIVDFKPIRAVSALPIDIETGSNDLIITPYQIGNNNARLLKDSSWVDIGESFNLQSWSTSNLLVAEFSNYKTLHLIGALEWLQDIRPLIKALRLYLLNDDEGTIRYWPNPDEFISRGFRDWKNLKRIAELFDHSGFKTAIDLESNSLVLTSSKVYYANFLDSNNLPEPNIEHVIITTEHPDYGSTGGIGSYVKEASRLYGEKTTVLILGLDNDKLTRDKILSTKKLIGEETYKKYFSYDFDNASMCSLASFYQIMFLYDNVKILEGSDYGSLNLSRIIQAKKTGLIPSSIKLVTVCHGSNIYVDSAAGRYPSKDNLATIQKEVYSIVNSDSTIFLTDFLKDLYANYGVEANNPIKYRLPINIDQYKDMGISMPTSFEPVENIYYIGKLSKMKGGDSFLKVILNLAKRGRKYNVICASTYNNPEPEIKKLLKELSTYKNIKLSLKCYQREELIKELNVNSINSIAVIPYPGDNHPNVVLELMLVGMDFIASNKGGIPELIPNKQEFIIDIDIEAMANRVVSLESNRAKRFALVQDNRFKYLAEQKKINNEYKLDILCKNVITIPTSKAIKKQDCINKDVTVSVIIPCYNTEVSYIKEVCNSLEGQSLKPDKVIFINDGSTEEGYFKKLKYITKTNLHSVDYEVVNKLNNAGLSSARNCGLNRAETKYVITLDSDDIIDNYFIEYMVRAMTSSTDDTKIGVTPFLNVFYDKKDYTKEKSFHHQYMPYGSTLGAAFFPNNNYGSASAIFDRVKLVNATGGWDESSKAMYEDWALYIKLNSLSYHVDIMPRACYFYRVRENSMLRSYSNTGGYTRLIHNYINLSKYDAYLILSQMYNYYIGDSRSGFSNIATQDEIIREGLQSVFGTFNTPRISKLVKISKLMDIYSNRVPDFFKKIIAKSAKLMVRIIGPVYSRIK